MTSTIQLTEWLPLMKKEDQSLIILGHKKSEQGQHIIISKDRIETNPIECMDQSLMQDSQKEQFRLIGPPKFIPEDQQSPIYYTLQKEDFDTFLSFWDSKQSQDCLDSYCDLIEHRYNLSTHLNHANDLLAKQQNNPYHEQYPQPHQPPAEHPPQYLQSTQMPLANHNQHSMSHNLQSTVIQAPKEFVSESQIPLSQSQNFFDPHSQFMDTKHNTTRNNSAPKCHSSFLKPNINYGSFGLVANSMTRENLMRSKSMSQIQPHRHNSAPQNQPQQPQLPISQETTESDSNNQNINRCQEWVNNCEITRPQKIYESKEKITADTPFSKHVEPPTRFESPDDGTNSGKPTSSIPQAFLKNMQDLKFGANENWLAQFFEMAKMQARMEDFRNQQQAPNSARTYPNRQLQQLPQENFLEPETPIFQEYEGENAPTATPIKKESDFELLNKLAAEYQLWGINLDSNGKVLILNKNLKNGKIIQTDPVEEVINSHLPHCYVKTKSKKLIKLTGPPDVKLCRPKTYGFGIAVAFHQGFPDYWQVARSILVSISAEYDAYVKPNLERKNKQPVAPVAPQPQLTAQPTVVAVPQQPPIPQQFQNSMQPNMISVANLPPPEDFQSVIKKSTKKKRHPSKLIPRIPMEGPPIVNVPKPANTNPTPSHALSLKPIAQSTRQNKYENLLKNLRNKESEINPLNNNSFADHLASIAGKNLAQMSSTPHPTRIQSKSRFDRHSPIPNQTNKQQQEQDLTPKAPQKQANKDFLSPVARSQAKTPILSKSDDETSTKILQPPSNFASEKKKLSPQQVRNRESSDEKIEKIPTTKVARPTRKRQKMDNWNKNLPKHGQKSSSSESENEAKAKPNPRERRKLKKKQSEEKSQKSSKEQEAEPVAAEKPATKRTANKNAQNYREQRQNYLSENRKVYNADLSLQDEAEAKIAKATKPNKTTAKSTSKTTRNTRASTAKSNILEQEPEDLIPVKANDPNSSDLILNKLDDSNSFDFNFIKNKTGQKDENSQESGRQTPSWFPSQGSQSETENVSRFTEASKFDNSQDILGTQELKEAEKNKQINKALNNKIGKKMLKKIGKTNKKGDQPPKNSRQDGSERLPLREKKLNNKKLTEKLDALSKKKRFAFQNDDNETEVDENDTENVDSSILCA